MKGGVRLIRIGAHLQCEVFNFQNGLYNIFNLMETEKEEWKWAGFVGLVGVHREPKTESLCIGAFRGIGRTFKKALKQARDLCCNIIVLNAFVCGRSSSL